MLPLLLSSLFYCFYLSNDPLLVKPKVIDVYLIGGQSNATGQGYVANLPKTAVADTSVWIFHSGAPHLDSGLPPFTWLPLHPASESPDRFGPELGFGTGMQSFFPKRKIALIKHAHSGTSLYKDWTPGTNRQDSLHWGPQFKDFVKTIEAGLAQLRQMGYQPVIRGMIWQQGEADADVGNPTSSQYGPNLSHFIGRVREQFQCPKMVFIYGYVYPPPSQLPGREQVRQAQRDIDQHSGSKLAVKGAYVVETDDFNHRADDPNSPYPNDHIHFGTTGTWELGKRMAERMYQAVK